ncbi:MAG: collagen-like protein, partial [Flavobacteriaceae bacterium]
MKKATLIFGAFLTLFFISCEGPQGPPGFDGFDGIDGQDGQDGINILGKVIDIEGDFTPENDYSIFFEFPQTVEVFETDVVLVYLLWDQTSDSNG